MKLKEESEKAGLKLNIKKTKIVAFDPIISWKIDGEKVEDFIFLGSKITVDSDCCPQIKRFEEEYYLFSYWKAKKNYQ